MLPAFAVAALAVASLAVEPWPSFRGHGARGIAEGHPLPVRWDVATGEGVRWKTAVPGLGHSSPIVWGDRLYVTTAVSGQDDAVALGDTGGIRMAKTDQRYSWRLLCLSARDGRVLWDREAFAGVPRAARHVKASQANATPATDGRHVAALFPEGLAVFDVEGRLLWKADLGVLDPGLFGDKTSAWGHASSPVIAGGRVIVQVDRHAGSYLAAYDVASGKQAWRVERDERPVWATPTPIETAGVPELLVVGGYHVRGYDARDGKERWRFKDEAEVKSTTAFEADGLLVFSGGYRGRPMFALRQGGTGDLSVPEGATGAALAWRTDPGGPYTSTPLAYRGLLYAVRDEGILLVHDLVTGQRLATERTRTTHSASPVAGDGKVYLAGEDGEVLVLEAGRTPRILARNAMGDSVMATPALAGGTLFVRTRSHVFALAPSTSAPSRD